MAAIPTTQQINPVAAQARLIELQHPELSITDEKLVALARLQAHYRIQDSEVGTTFGVPQYIENSQSQGEDKEELKGLIETVYQRTIRYAFRSCNYVIEVTGNTSNSKSATKT